MSAQGLSPDVAKSSPEAEDSSPAGAASVRGTRESLWKRSKRTLGTTQFAFLQGKVATSGGEGENQSPSDKSKVAPSKRREQVRRAQRTHRQRTEAYVKTLEDEVIRLRKSEATALRKNTELQAEVDALKLSINNGNNNANPNSDNLSPPQSSNYPYPINSQTQQFSLPSSTATVNDPMALDIVGVKFYEDDFGNLALETDKNNFRPNTTLPQFRNSAFNALDVSGINLNGSEDNYLVPPPPPPKNKDRVVLVTDDYQTGIDFVLLLEQPCIPHIHPHRSISPDTDANPNTKSRFRLKSKSSSESNASSGHVLTASVSLLNAYSSSSSISSTNTYGANNNNTKEIQPGTTWTMTSNDIERLLYLSSSLQLEGEITPVEAWNRLRLHPGFRSLSKEKFEGLKAELKGLVACYGFGAALDELNFHNTIDRYFMMITRSKARSAKIESKPICSLQAMKSIKPIPTCKFHIKRIKSSDNKVLAPKTFPHQYTKFSSNGYGEWLVVICSYKRAEILCQKTLNYLTKTDISLDRIFIIVGNTAEFTKYVEILGENWIPRIIIGEVGRKNVINFTRTFFPEGQELFFMDDDIMGLYRKGKDGLHKNMSMLLDLTAFVTKAFAETRRVGASLWGIYPICNPFFMRMKAITYDLRFIGGAVRGMINCHSSDQMATMNEGEDFERLFKAYLRDGMVVRYNHVAMMTRYNRGSGGMVDSRTEENVVQAKMKLAEVYPDLCRVTKRWKKGQTLKTQAGGIKGTRFELRLKDMRGTVGKKKLKDL